MLSIVRSRCGVASCRTALVSVRAVASVNEVGLVQNQQVRHAGSGGGNYEDRRTIGMTVNQQNPDATHARMTRVMRDEGCFKAGAKKRHLTKSARKYQDRLALKRRLERQKINKLIKDAQYQKNLGY
eukprot:CAMPEP_0203753718 /NCGR_PEP_ID=MMETSP0098-20131031/7443_1 /ASSEMBLY_ACC=CAM_ASM_000208 /TAXON_ID=96639 /ORGANISM=" , Strain NY0313808BC1" /LENGTH=126 /DNA_ID=CAMNT_0050644427 /DNA_START=9 /DNA_END=389 /DNA_ORIENTATION=+